MRSYCRLCMPDLEPLLNLNVVDVEVFVLGLLLGRPVPVGGRLVVLRRLLLLAVILLLLQSKKSNEVPSDMMTCKISFVSCCLSVGQMHQSCPGSEASYRVTHQVSNKVGLRIWELPVGRLIQHTKSVSTQQVNQPDGSPRSSPNCVHFKCLKYEVVPGARRSWPCRRTRARPRPRPPRRSPPPPPSAT